MRTPILPVLIFVVGIACFSPTARGQLLTVGDDTSTPVEGAGHNYIKALSDTINPANGSLSVRIAVPTPKGRGITLPFSFAYDTNGIVSLSAPSATPQWYTPIASSTFLPGAP
jgi:hypothetical protein